MHRSHPTTRPHPTNDGRYRPTPPVSKGREATPGELMCYQTGTSRFPHLGSLGGFHTWPLEHLYEGVTLTGNAFNCMAWAVGHTDRWIDPGTVAEMEDLCKPSTKILYDKPLTLLFLSQGLSFSDLFAQ